MKMKISEIFISLAKWLEDPNNEALLLAEYDEECLTVAAETCAAAASVLKLGAEQLDVIEPAPESTLNSQSLEDIASLASTFDSSEDPQIKRLASVLDEILLTIAAPPDAVKNFKLAKEKEIDVIKQKYQDSKKKLDEMNKISDTTKDIEKSPFYKEYITMEYPLSTRTCPDHPGAQISRVGEDTWQCDLDKKVYNYQTGFTTERGEKVPGGSVSNQTPKEEPDTNLIFDTREGRLNGSA